MDLACRLSTFFRKDRSITQFRLATFDLIQKIFVAADASNHGVGAVILHIFADKSEKAIMHAARSFTPAKRNYSQIEKEALGLIFAVNKFHKMLFRRRFTFLTNHKPLLSIFDSKKEFQCTQLVDYND